MAVRTNTDTEQEIGEQDTDTGKQLAPPYEESPTDIARENLTPERMSQNPVDINYLTFGGNEKTVRCSGAVPPTPHNDVPTGCVEFQSNGTHYRYDTTENRLLSVGYRTQTVARPDQITSIELVQYPDPAVVTGVVQEGVDATVYYRSPRSDRIQEITIAVETVSDQGLTLTGTKNEGQYISQIDRERNVMADTEQGWKRIGKVARVEFPKGHQYTVAVEGLKDESGKKFTKRIEKAVDRVLNQDDLSVKVSYQERIEP